MFSPATARAVAPTAVDGDLTVTGPLDDLSAELRIVRAAEVALDLEPRLHQLPMLAALEVVRTRVRGGTTLGLAQAIVSVVAEAAGRLDHEQPEHVLAQLLFRVHPDTSGLHPAQARTHTQKASHVETRQFRARQEPRLCRLVAQAVLELQAEHGELTGE